MRNLSVGAGAVSLFELAQVVLAADAPIPDQPQRIAGVMTGPGIGFSDLRGVLETLYKALHLDLEVTRSSRPYLHPGRSAECPAGFFGELHPLVGEAFGTEVPVAVFELEVSTLAGAQPTVVLHRDVTGFPPLRQDIAVVVSDDVAAGDVVATARAAGGALLSRVEVFDVYRGDQIGAGNVSLALHLVFQAPDRTLTDAEADAARAKIIAALEDEYGATLRA